MAWLQILTVTAAVFSLQLALPGLTGSFAFVPANALAAPWTFVTAIFLHGGFTHLFFNMWALFIFGPVLERRIGEMKFYALYFLAGIVGNLAFIFFYPSASGVGASGAIFGLIGALAVLMPNMTILFFFIPLPMWIAAIVWGGMEFLLSGAPDAIARFVHIAGLLVGVAWGLVLKNEEPPEYYSGSWQ